MNKKLLSFLCCIKCKGNLNLKTRTNSKEILNNNFINININNNDNTKDIGFGTLREKSIENKKLELKK